MTQDPPDQNGDQGLSGANGPQNTSQISVPAIVKVRKIHHSFHPSVIVNLNNLKWQVKMFTMSSFITVKDIRQEPP